MMDDDGSGRTRNEAQHRNREEIDDRVGVVVNKPDADESKTGKKKHEYTN